MGFTPEEIGALHNQILHRLDAELLSDNEVCSLETFTQKESSFCTKILLEITNKPVKESEQINELISFSNQVVYNNIRMGTKSQTAANDELAKFLLTKVDSLLTCENFLSSISKKEAILIKDIIASFKKYETSKDLTGLKEDLNNHKTKIFNSHFDETTSEGFLAEMTISVAENSIRYWTVDSLTRFNSDSKIVWWAVSDAVGAVIGAGGAILKDTLNDDEIDWTDVAVDGLIGGVAASIPGGKAMKRIVKSLF